MEKRYSRTSSLIHDPFFFIRRKGFTIIELLVVIAIIGMIGSLAFIQMQGARARGRDAQREKEIKTIQSALTLHVTNKRAFPVYSGPITGRDSLSVELIASDSAPAVPHDPLNAGVYMYAYDSENGQTYVLTYTLETDSIPGKAKGAQTVSP
ncbi:MAG: type II secretion system protein [Patescibacteria group bacterium]